MSNNELFQSLLNGLSAAKDTVVSAGQTVAARSRQAYEQADLKHKRKEALCELGLVYYRLVRDPENADNAMLEELVEEITALDAALADLEADHTEEGIRECPFCGRKNPVDASFCSGCGVSLAANTAAGSTEDASEKTDE